MLVLFVHERELAQACCLLTVCCCTLFAGVSVCRSELLVTVAPITLRAAFSNIRTWNILQADMQLAGQVQQLRVIHACPAVLCVCTCFWH
jgi:hypothetical protein